MLAALITILFVISIIYRREAISMQQLKKPFVYRYRKLLALLVVAILPVLIMNVVRPLGRPLTPAEVLEQALERGTESDIIGAYERNLFFYPDSIPLYFGYTDAMEKSSFVPCEEIDYSRFTHDQEIIGISREYHQLDCSSSEYNAYSSGLHDFDLTATAYINFVRGSAAQKAGNYDQAERYFRQEILVNPEYDRTYMALYRLYRYEFPEKLNNFLLQKEMADHLPGDLLHFEYFNMGYYWKYFVQIFSENFLHIHPLAFLAALVISIIWLIYLRSLDVFNKEKWVDIIAVFIGGILLTNFCLPMYHYAHYVLDMRITGKSWNDFIYSTVVIGGSEETVKMIPWVIFALATRKMKEPYDYILYASVSALGFAFAENWIYLENPHNIVGRFMMSTVSHMFDASVLAYAVILARYKFKQLAWKIITPIIGFALACLSHGFYDFWLISPATRGLYMITTVFFILSMHVWFFLKNNSMNHSQFYNSTPFNVNFQLNLFMFGVVGVLMLEYVLISYDFGAIWANQNLTADAWMICAFLLYMTFNLKHIRLARGVWMRYRLPAFRRFATSLFTLPDSSYAEPEYEDISGISLRLFAPKTNPYIGGLLPVSGICTRKICVGENPDWYLFRLNKALGYPGHRDDYVIIKPKSSDHTLKDDKIEIYLMLIPNNTLIDDTLEIEELRYTGRAYSRPIS